MSSRRDSAGGKHFFVWGKVAGELWRSIFLTGEERTVLEYRLSKLLIDLARTEAVIFILTSRVSSMGLEMREVSSSLEVLLTEEEETRLELITPSTEKILTSSTGKILTFIPSVSELSSSSSDFSVRDSLMTERMPKLRLSA